MASSHSDQLRPLKLDTGTGEPYLQLDAPFSHIVLTPPRLSDWPALVENLNDPVVLTGASGAWKNCLIHCSATHS